MATSVMHFYAISYREFLNLPYYTFWELTRNIERIRAAEDLRFCRALGSMFSESGQKYFDELSEAIGEIVTVDEQTKNSQALTTLRGLIGGKK